MSTDGRLGTARARVRCGVDRDPIDEFGSLFTRDGERFVPTQLTRGPWDPNAMHGGAPSALMAHVLGRHDPGPASFIARLTVELLRPVPLVPMQAVARTFRPGKNVQWVEGALLADDVEVVRAVALRLRTQPVDVSETISPAVVDAAATRRGRAAAVPVLRPRSRRVLVRATRSGSSPARFGVAGPATAWIRLRCPVVDDEPPTPFERVAAVADFGSGVGNPLTFTTASAINPEVTIHVHRHPEGEWVCLESGGWAEAHGVGLADTRLYDERGRARPRAPVAARHADERAASTRLRRADERRGDASVLAYRVRRRPRAVRTRRCGTRCSRAVRRAAAAGRRGCDRRARRWCAVHPR